jgi:hypothetical protein
MNIIYDNKLKKNYWSDDRLMFFKFDQLDIT